MSKGPNPDVLKRANRKRFVREALRKSSELQGRMGPGRPTTILGSSVTGSAVGTTLLVGKG